MGSSVPSRSRAPSRLAPADLLRRLGERLAQSDTARTALLAITLSPSDRLMAIGRGATERAVLAEVEHRVGQVLRAGDRYAFASPEELWVMLVDLPSESLAELAGRTLLERLRRPIATTRADGSQTTLQLHPAIGGAWASARAAIDPLQLLSAATEAASGGHGHAGDRIELRRVDGSRDGAPLQATLERDLARALDANELEVHFQPQVDLRSGQCTSAEALIRWRPAQAQPIDPGNIVAICERRGLIGQLTRFTLNTALRHLSNWQALDVSVAVNLSATTLSDPSLPMLVAQALDTWDIPAHRLTLELTESALIHSQKVASATMKQLHRLGCRLSIDDFGTGYSPYTYLHQFSFDELKIDQMFVRRMSTDAADLRIVRSLVDLAHTFGMHTVAEGVENEPAERALRGLGCDFAQGWHLSAALAPDDFLAWTLARQASPGPQQQAAVHGA